MKSFLKIMIGCSLIIGMTQVQAQDTPEKGQLALTAQHIKPALTGKTMDQIITMLGEPQQKMPAVGEPPITRWQYANQTVYFEKDRVIHSVPH